MKPKRVVIYVRVSVKKSDQKSPASQLRECEELCERKGYVIVGRFPEPGKSAFRKKAKRPQWEKAMTMIERKQADIILVWKIDRFYRDGVEFNVAVSRLLAADGNIESVMEPDIRTTDARGRNELSGMAFQAEMESESRAMQAAAFHRHRIGGEDLAGTPGGPRPFGYRRNRKGELTIDPAESKAIVKAAEVVTSGESLIRYMRETNLTKRDHATGEAFPFTLRGMRNVLTNPTTYGMRRHPSTGALVRGTWEPILPPESFAAITDVFASRAATPGTSNAIRHLLSGRMTCGKCRGAMSTHHHQRSGKRRYECQSCGNSCFEQVADDHVMKELWERVTPDVWQSWRIEGHSWDPRVLDNIRMRRQNIDTKYLTGGFDGDMERYNRMDADLAEQERLAMSDEPLDLPNVDDIRESWDSLSVIDQRKVIKQAFQSITLNPFTGSRDIENRIAFDTASERIAAA